MHRDPYFLCNQSKAGQLQGVKFFFSGEKLFFTSYFTKCSNLLGQIMTPRSGNSHIEYCSMLRIVSFVIHFKASTSLDVFIFLLSQIMVIFDSTKEHFPNFQNCSVSTFHHILGLIIPEKFTVTLYFLFGFQQP